MVFNLHLRSYALSSFIRLSVHVPRTLRNKNKIIKYEKKKPGDRVMGHDLVGDVRYNGAPGVVIPSDEDHLVLNDRCTVKFDSGELGIVDVKYSNLKLLKPVAVKQKKNIFRLTFELFLQ